ncbi:MAG TPA: hypothetical protein PL180_13295 [Spirochaetota bacterium]|nr:hypothetical protein [Spirochaetota bacterium]
MNFLVPVMMWGWIPVTIILFRKFAPQKAILISVIGGILFLPATAFDIPVILYNKETAIAISLLWGIIFSYKKSVPSFSTKPFNIPIILWCIMSPFLSILTNGLGLYNAVAAVIESSLAYGVFYVIGRIYFSDKDALRLLTTGIIVGGLIYVPFALFEVRMSPQLSNIFYGFFPHSFAQHFRYDGYRPIVFMQHGLMVAMWMSVTFTVSLWLYGTREVVTLKKIPMSVVIIFLLITTVLCKSANGWIYSMSGVFAYYYYKKTKSTLIFKLLVLAIPVYLILRVSGILPINAIIDFSASIFDAERVDSLAVRLFQEDVFSQKALENPLFGWGWMGRAWPRNMATGEDVVQMIDSLYLIAFSNYGLFGLFSLYAVLLLGPWKVMKSRTESIDAIVLGVILIFFTIDTLINGMVNSVFILTAGALSGYSDKLKLGGHTVT